MLKDLISKLAILNDSVFRNENVGSMSFGISTMGIELFVFVLRFIIVKLPNISVARTCSVTMLQFDANTVCGRLTQNA